MTLPENVQLYVAFAVVPFLLNYRPESRSKHTNSSLKYKIVRVLGYSANSIANCSADAMNMQLQKVLLNSILTVLSNSTH